MSTGKVGKSEEPEAGRDSQASPIPRTATDELTAAVRPYKTGPTNTAAGQWRTHDGPCFHEGLLAMDGCWGTGSFS